MNTDALNGDDLPDLTELDQGRVEVITPADIRMLEAATAEQEAELRRMGVPDLDDLLTESKATEPAGDGLMDLDDLLKESVSQVNEQKAAKLARDRLKKGGNYAEKEEDLLRIREWEAKHVWKDEANVGFFIQHQCECGTLNNVWEGLFRRQSHRHMSDAKRWQRAEVALTSLPNETVIQGKPTPVCNDCVAVKGWNTTDKFISWSAEMLDEGETE